MCLIIPVTESLTSCGHLLSNSALILSIKSTAFSSINGICDYQLAKCQIILDSLAINIAATDDMRTAA